MFIKCSLFCLVCFKDHCYRTSVLWNILLKNVTLPIPLHLYPRSPVFNSVFLRSYLSLSMGRDLVVYLISIGWEVL